jgi:hypothetical protein
VDSEKAHQSKGGNDYPPRRDRRVVRLCHFGGFVAVILKNILKIFQKITKKYRLSSKNA